MIQHGSVRSGDCSLFITHVQSQPDADNRVRSSGDSMDRRPLLPGPVAVLLALVLIIFLLEKIGQALLSISNVILLVTLAWILTLILRPLVNRIHAFQAPGSIIRPVRRRWGDHWADRLIHPSYGFSIFVVYFLLVT